MKKIISVIVPVHNEGANVEMIHGRIVKVFDNELGDYQLQLIFTDNSSTDDTYSRIMRLVDNDFRVKGIRLSRNFGFQANILAGVLNADGDAVVQIDADGEDPPEVLPAMVKKWEEGNHVVYGIRTTRQEAICLTWCRKAFYRLLQAITSVELPVDAGDFRLIDRKIVELIKNRFPERNLYLRGLIAFTGFRQVGVSYSRQERHSGKSNFTLYRYLSLAMDAATSFSRVPLKMVSLAGLLISALAFFAMLFYFVLHIRGAVPVQGFTTLILVILLGLGVQLFSIGLVGEYICRIYDEVKCRPRYIVAESCGFDREMFEG
jgi:polyisoprenyl-phosphate glycosyltransferase